MLSPQAEAIINDYITLPFPNRQVTCPYYNNRRSGMRGGLRVLIGKGSPEDIAEEALIISLKDKIDLEGLDNEGLQKFLVDHRLGVDCSGFAYHVLNAELCAQHNKRLRDALFFPQAKNIFRKLIIKMRPAENAGVKVLAHDRNSSVVAVNEAMPGDFIVMLGTNPKHDYDHVVLITDVSREKNNTVLTYTHALQWVADGKYNHGVRRGTITVNDNAAPLTKAIWTEQNCTGEKNETYQRATEAQTLELRRLKALAK